MCMLLARKIVVVPGQKLTIDYPSAIMTQQSRIKLCRIE